jgi:hypothetical protein
LQLHLSAAHRHTQQRHWTLTDRTNNCVAAQPSQHVDTLCICSVAVPGLSTEVLLNRWHLTSAKQKHIMPTCCAAACKGRRAAMAGAAAASMATWTSLNRQRHPFFAPTSQPAAACMCLCQVYCRRAITADPALMQAPTVCSQQRAWCARLRQGLHWGPITAFHVHGMFIALLRLLRLDA